MANVLTPAGIKELWINAGGNPQYADQAATLAIAKSGGNADAAGGLWGVKPSAVTSPTDDARAAIEASSNGRDFAALGIPTPKDIGAMVAGWVTDATGIPGAAAVVNYVKWTFMIVAGWAFMLTGLAVMVFGARPVRQAVGAGLSTFLGGAGFGIGGNLGSKATQPTEEIVSGTPPASGPPAPPSAPVGPPPPPGPGGPPSPPLRGRKIQWATFPTREMVPMSEGGPMPRPTSRRSVVPRKRRPISVGGGIYKTRESKGGRHRA